MRHRSLLLCVAALASAVFAGCSSDRQVIHSSMHHPVSASVVDTVTQASLWSMDVPPGHTLVLDGRNRHDLPAFRLGNTPATDMTWKLYDTAVVESAYVDSDGYVGSATTDSGAIALTGNPIRIDISLTAPAPASAPASQAQSAAAPESVSAASDAAADADAAEEAPVAQQMHDAADAAESMPEASATK